MAMGIRRGYTTRVTQSFGEQKTSVDQIKKERRENIFHVNITVVTRYFNDLCCGMNSIDIVNVFWVRHH